MEETPMHIHTLDRLQHPHNFADDSSLAERNTRNVMVFTALTMVTEIVTGMMTGSMALLADGWHMTTHVAALGVTLIAYRYARSQADNPRFTFGTGKISVLGGFTNATALAVVAMVMSLESVARLLEPRAIHFNEAIVVAVAGLFVNLASGLMLRDHGHGHEHGQNDAASHHDHNLRAAYLHVLADALTSLLAIVALFSGKYLGLAWLDPMMGLVGAAVITRWAYGLARDTGYILIDCAPDERIRTAIMRAIENDADNRIADLHVWCVGPHHYSVVISVVTHQPRAPEHYKHLLIGIPDLAHVLVEVNPCSDPSCVGSPA